MTDPSIRVRACGALAARVALVATAVALAAAAAAQAQGSASLSQTRFAALDAMYTAFVAFEESPTPAATADARRVCGALDRGDRLLAVTRRVCLASLTTLPAAEAYGACDTRSGCRRAARRLRIAFTELLVRTRASNRIVAAEVAPGACRTELTAHRALLRAMEKLRDGLRLLERGLRSGSSATIGRAESRILAASLVLAQQPSAAQAHETFRGACAPSG
jgi:hypothetical protein